MNKTYSMYGVAVAIGIVVWIGVSIASGRREAWDSGLYFSIGMPIICIASAGLGFVEPNRPWLWGVLPQLGQFLWMLLAQGPGNLLPLGMVAFGIFSVPSIITAMMGAMYGRRRAL